MSSVIPDTVSPSLFIFSATISACFTRSISSQVRSSYYDGHPFWKKSFITSPRMPYFSPALSPRYNSSKLICAISAPPLQYTTVPQFGAEVQRKNFFMILHIKYLKSYGLSYMASSCFDMRDNTFAKSSVTGRIL